jgi:hypothetical protein
MTTATKQFIVSFPLKNKTYSKAKTFFDFAKRHMVKGKKADKDLSQRIDRIAYGV